TPGATDQLHPNLGLGRALLSTSDFPGAEAAFRAALAAWPKLPYGTDDSSEALVGLGRALLNQGKKAQAEAVTTLESCRDQHPESAEARYWLAQAYLKKGDLQKARAEADRATSLDDRYAEAWQLLGDLCEKSDRATAARAWKRFLELAPSDPAAKTIRKRL